VEGGHAVGSDRDYRTTTAGSRHAGHPDADIAASLGRYNGLSSLRRTLWADSA
jgi:hypothetical protein